MRKKLCSAAVCCLVLFLTACGLASQASVAALVERDVQALEALAGEIALAGAAGDAEYPGVDRISYDSRTGQVQFECGVSGFASQTSYNGFYYSPGDVPLGFGGTGGYDARSVGRGLVLGRNGGGQLVLHREAAQRLVLLRNAFLTAARRPHT